MTLIALLAEPMSITPLGDPGMAVRMTGAIIGCAFSYQIGAFSKMYWRRWFE